MKDTNHLTLEQKVGQLFVLGFQGYGLDRDTRTLLDVIRPGGFLLFQRNIESFDQIYGLTNELRNISATPAILAIDHEGGRVPTLGSRLGLLRAGRFVRILISRNPNRPSTLQRPWVG